MSGIKRFENSNGLCINRKNMFSAFIWSLSRKILSIDGKVDIQSNSPLSSRMSCALKKHRSRRSSKWSSRPQNRCLSRQNPLKERKVDIRSNGADASSRDDHWLDLLLLDFFTVRLIRNKGAPIEWKVILLPIDRRLRLRLQLKAKNMFFLLMHQSLLFSALYA